MPKGTKQPKEASIHDVLIAIHAFANDTERRLSDIDGELSDLKHHQTKQDISLFDLKTALFKANARLNTLPTKDYLDEKIGSLRGDITSEQKMMREAIKKTVQSLERKKVFQPAEAKSILQLVEFQAR